MKIIFGSDHGGFELKLQLIPFVKELGFDVEDIGNYSTDSVDYPEYGKKVAQKVSQDSDTLGIIFCGTGIGISIAANKVEGIRAALCTTPTHARLTRQHNNANILALGGRMTGIELAKDIVKTFLETKFEGGRHKRRVHQIEECV